MKRVGLRELKARLSFYIRQVRAGRHVLVTHRGEIVAELSPPGEAPHTQGQVPAALASMARRGLITLAASSRRPATQPYPDLGGVLKRGRVAELLEEERGGK
jgi:antitoxin (DNA-binding transcriptional repressor) of toxin-antitoxin stability system